ncbi:hypothetical protein BH09BAC5_BH09BAC5_23260 [soil metagenome]
MTNQNQSTTTKDSLRHFPISLNHPFLQVSPTITLSTGEGLQRIFLSLRKSQGEATITLSFGEGLQRIYLSLRKSQGEAYASTTSATGAFPDKVSRIWNSIRSIRSGLSMNICFTASRPCPSFVSS